MNIQQHVTMEMLLSISIVGSLALLYIGFCLGKCKAKEYNDANHWDSSPGDNHVYQEGDVRYNRPQAGQLWYRRTSPGVPFIDTNHTESPCKILSYRLSEDYAGVKHEFVKFLCNEEEFIEPVREFFDSYMKDEFDDVVQLKAREEEPLELLVELDESLEPQAEETPAPERATGSTISIEGKEYILSPV